jgi:uncharacterized protein (DUF1330 family)
MPLTPTASQVERLAADGSEEPVVMLNLVRFKDRADGIDEGMSGREAYALYGEQAAPFLAAVGGRMLSAVEARQVVIGPEEIEWDLALLVEYPSRGKFLQMAVDPGYLKVHEHRAAALADSRLIACAKMPGPG